MSIYLSLLILISLFIVVSSETYHEVNNITLKDPNFPFKGEMFTGFIVIDNKTEANLYYHLYAFNQTKLSNSAPLIIWFQGGPGCASALGNYNELGPVYVSNGTSSDFKFERNLHTWNNYAHLLFIDQPAGSGFSQAKNLKVNSTKQAAQHIQVFLARFYQLYPELAKNRLYLFGESYAGKYVPTFAYELLQNETFSSQIKLAGIGVGNGWSDPKNQLPTYGTFGYAAGLIDTKTRDYLRREENKAIELINKGEYSKATAMSNKIWETLLKVAGNVNGFDYRSYDNSKYPFTFWLNKTETQDFLGVPHQPFVKCNADLSDDFADDNTQSVADLYPKLISEMPVLLYNGQDDDNCDYEGTMNYISKLDWKDINNFRMSKRVPWKLEDGSTAGLVKGYGNFTFLLVFKAGHMVPISQPKAAEEMVYKFLNGIPLHTEEMYLDS